MEITDAVKLLKAAHEAVLATLEGGAPFTSGVNYFWVPDEGAFGKIVILMSDLARHSKNAHAHSAVSLQVIEKGEDPLYQRPRVSVQGRLEKLKDSDQAKRYKETYLKLFPAAQIFFTLADFNFWELSISELYLIAGFGRAQAFK